MNRLPYSEALVFMLGAQLEQVDERRQQPSAQLVFEYKCYPEAKILSSTDLIALRQDLGNWYRVAEVIGASEAFARQNAKMTRLN